MLVELGPCRSKLMRDLVCGRTADSFYFKLLGTALKTVAVTQIPGLACKPA